MEGFVDRLDEPVTQLGVAEVTEDLELSDDRTRSELQCLWWKHTCFKSEQSANALQQVKEQQTTGTRKERWRPGRLESGKGGAEEGTERSAQRSACACVEGSMTFTLMLLM